MVREDIMKMDLDYIKKLLNILNDCDDDRVELNYLYTTLQISSNSESRPLEKKLRHHLFLLGNYIVLYTKIYRKTRKKGRN